MSYCTTVREQIDTGDIILCSGTGRISNGIKAGTFSKWSHVAVAVYVPQSDIVLAYQSTTLNKIKDWTDDSLKQGVQINLLSDMVSTYPGEIAVRHLDVHRTPKMLSDLANFRLEMKDRPYEKSKLELIKSAYDGPGGHNEEDLSSMFCSELVAELYQRWGLIDNSLSSNEFVPANFSTGRDIELLKGATLGPEIYLT